MQYKLSIIVPARNEEWLSRTIQDLLEHTSDKTEVIVILDGYLPNPPLEADVRTTVIYNPISVGQRASCNQAVKVSKAKYVCKLDAHCAVDEGFDTKMIKAMEELGDDVTLIPVMKNLHCFDWVCKKCGSRWYQSPTPTKCLKADGTNANTDCDSKEFEKDVVWRAKPSPNSITFRFDKTMHFQYFSELAKRPENIKGAMTLGGVRNTNYRETMSIQGSCFMVTKKKWLELDICSETDFHSWGQQGVEVACKAWLSGGRVITNLYTWQSHMFRTRGGDFGFPYPNPGSKVDENRERSRELFQRDGWPKATRKFQWILDKFNPPEWVESTGMIYYTHNQLKGEIAKPVQDRLSKISKDKNISITCSSLKKMDFGDRQVRFPSMKRGFLAMYKQILGALEKSPDDTIFFTEHDILYHESHFDFDPPDKDTFYFNQNVWFLRIPDGHALHYDVNQLSGMCVHRETALIHYRERFKMIEKKEKELSETEFNKFIRHMGHEPFTHGRIKWENQFKYDVWKSKKPNIDLKHGENLTGQRWKKEQYRNQHLLINWTESDDEIDGWGSTSDIVKTLQ